MMIYVDIIKHNLLHSEKQMVDGFIGHENFIMIMDEEMLGV